MVDLRRIKELRVLNNYTQNYLAELLNIKASAYNLKENNKRRFNLKELDILSKEFEVDIKELLILG